MVDGSGQYSFTVDPGKYNITYDKSGYIQENITILQGQLEQQPIYKQSSTYLKAQARAK